jgi:hypothetical protein
MDRGELEESYTSAVAQMIFRTSRSAIKVAEKDDDDDDDSEDDGEEGSGMEGGGASDEKEDKRKTTRTDLKKEAGGTVVRRPRSKSGKGGEVPDDSTAVETVAQVGERESGAASSSDSESVSDEDDDEDEDEEEEGGRGWEWDGDASGRLPPAGSDARTLAKAAKKVTHSLIDLPTALRTMAQFVGLSDRVG